MLENRSFDHMLGFSGIRGVDAVDGSPTAVQGLTGTETNAYGGTAYTAAAGATNTMPVDPGHEFLDVLEQLAGTAAAYVSGAYPTINGSGFVSDYAGSHSPDEGNSTTDLGAIMRGFSADQLPVLSTLAAEFAVCDHWFAAIPGPTVPNRLFACAATSDGLDHSPTTAELITWETIDGIAPTNGTIFDRIGRSPTSGWRIYSDGLVPLASMLKGVILADISPFSEFSGAVAKTTYPARLTWIEPNYGDAASGTYEGGNSQHPRDGVVRGEALLKATYEAIRNSPHWDTSLLIITWDEHGGFYDHVTPPKVTPPGDTQPGSKYNHYGFTFDQLGVRVPCVVVSPYIPAKTIDHRQYEHSSIPATVEKAFALPPMTMRDKQANDVLSLLSLPSPRIDAPTTLPEPNADMLTAPKAAAPASAPDPSDSVDTGNLPLFVHVAMRHDLQLSPASARHAILQRVQSITTRGQAAAYLAEVEGKMKSRP